MDFEKIKNRSDNFYSKVLFILGWIIIGLGVIGSFILGSSTSNYYSEFNGTVFFICLFSTVIVGFLILGIAEVINILNDNRRLLAAMNQNSDNPSGSDASIANSIVEELPEL